MSPQRVHGRGLHVQEVFPVESQQRQTGKETSQVPHTTEPSPQTTSNEIPNTTLTQPHYHMYVHMCASICTYNRPHVQMVTYIYIYIYMNASMSFILLGVLVHDERSVWTSEVFYSFSPVVRMYWTNQPEIHPLESSRDTVEPP